MVLCFLERTEFKNIFKVFCFDEGIRVILSFRFWRNIFAVRWVVTKSIINLSKERKNMKRNEGWVIKVCWRQKDNGKMCRWQNGNLLRTEGFAGLSVLSWVFALWQRHCITNLFLYSTCCSFSILDAVF